MTSASPPHLQPHSVLAIPSAVGYWGLTTSAQQQILSLEYLGLEHLGEKTLPNYRLEPATRLEQRLNCMLSRYFKGQPVDFRPLPFALPAHSKFLCAVLTGLQEIPYGSVQNYQWLAHHIGNPKALRAVGGALGHNPFPILIPCHRIISKSGSLGGFMRAHPSGSRIKAFLLGLEGIHFMNNRLEAI